MEQRRWEALRRVCEATAPTLSAIAITLKLDIKDDATTQQLVIAISKEIRDAEGQAHEETTLKVVENLAKTIQSTPASQIVSMRRELKLDGGITGGKDSLSFISFSRQLEAAQRKGYPEHEILDAIIMAVSPKLPLRRVLEASKLNLEGMKKLIFQYFKEPSPAELFTQLTQGTQRPGESTADFVMRMMDLRQRIKHSSHSVQYPASLVDQTFRQNVLTGLADIETRVGLQEVLSREGCTDEDISTKVHAMGACTRERDFKVSALGASAGEQTSKTVHCNQMQQEQKATAQTNVAKLTEVMEQLVTRIEVLERLEKHQHEQENRNRFKCRNCIENGRARCKHCWRCASGSHFERDCGKRAMNQGNGNVSR